MRALLLASGAVVLLPGSAAAVDIAVSNDATLRAAITGANSGDRIVFQNNITLSADLPLVQTNVTIVGNGNSLSGNNQFRGLFIGAFSGTTQVPVAVTVQDLAITNTTAQGGAGATGSAGAGGGAGLGGALFVANQATVTVSNVSLTGNAAIGGSGGSGGGNGFAGGGGMGGDGATGGNGGAGGGGGGLGRGANGGTADVNGQPGIASGASPAGFGGDAIALGGGPGGSGGAAGGGGGGGASGFDRGGGGGGVGGENVTSAGANGGIGGFGGGGGGGTSAAGGGFGGGGASGFNLGGNGGFGGGSGGNASGPFQNNTGGFGGGNGRGTAGGSGGGGGLGAGGGIFVQQGGNLTLGGPLTVNGNSVTGGTGGGAAGSGSALGAGLFLQGNGALTLSPGAGQTQTVSDAIADQTGSGGTGGNAGSYTLQKQGAGTTILSGVNSYTGGTTVSAGTLQGTTASLQGNIVNNANLVFDQNGNGSYSSAISGTGILTKTGNGTVTLAGSNTYQGGTAISGGTIAINNASALGTGTVGLSGGSLTGAATLTLANDITFAAGAGVIAATTGTTLTLAPNTLSFSVVPDTLMTFGSAADAGTVVYSAATSFITNIAFSTVVAGGTLRAGANTFGALTGNDRATTVVNAGATLDFNDFASTVANLQGGGSVLTGASAATAITIAQGNFSGAIGGAGRLVKTGAGTLTLTGANTYSGGTTVLGGTLQGTSTSLQGAITNNANVTFDQGFTGTYAGAMSGSGSLTKSGSGTLLLTGANSYGGGTMINGGTLSVSADANLGNAAGALIFGGGTLQTTASVITARATTLNAGGGTFDTAASTTLVHSGAIGGAGSLTKTGAGTLLLTGNNFYAGGTTVSGGILQGTPSSLQGNILNNASVWLTGSGTYGGNMSGSGGLLINSTGTLTLSGVNSYTGGTTVSGGVLQGNTQSLQGNILNNASVVFNQTGSGTYAGVMSGSGSMTVQGGGLLNLTGNGTYTGPTTVNASTLAVNGSLASSVNLVNGAVLMGNGSMGGLASSGGVLAPGNSIGMLTVNGTFSQLGGVYQVEANAQGQSDRINVTGTATIGGGATVQVLAQPGTYAPNTTYTILRANGGVSGTYSGVSSNFAFLTPSLSYDANDVFLTLSLQQNAFSSFGGNTPNQRAVGAVLDQTFGSASGDYATVLNAIATLSATEGPLALNAISGQQYAGFSNALVQGAQLFLSNFSNQAGGTGSGANKVALAEACVVACDATEPAVWGAWGGAVGGTGTIAGNSNAGAFTYSVGGFSGGLDRKFAPNFLAGATVGYLTGGQWTGGFDGRSVTDTVQAGVYASFMQGPVYVDGIAGYAYSANQMWRSITISGLQPRTAYGRTGANQFLGQLETGYRVELGGTAAAYLTPFARVQGSTATQNAFTETGAQSLNLSVAAQTTSSLRTVFGAQLGAALDLGLRDRIAAQLKLGWSHEYADTARPVTASFVGAPAVPFTVQGATPTRDGAVIGFSASTALADALGVYVRYEGTISGQDSSHALTAGLRATW